MSRPEHDFRRHADRSSPSSKHQSNHRGHYREPDVDERRARLRRNPDDLPPRSNSFSRANQTPIGERAPTSTLKGLENGSPSLNKGDDKVIENHFTTNGAITSPTDLRSLEDPGRRPSGFSSISKPNGSQPPAINTRPTMASPVKSPLASSNGPSSDPSTPRPQPPGTPIRATAESSPELEALMKTFGEYTQNVLETALIQCRRESLEQAEKQIRGDYERWSKYHDGFISIGEDQRRGLKTTESARELSQNQLSQAKKIGVKRTQQIASSILAAGVGKAMFQDDTTLGILDEKLSSQNEKIASLEKEIADLRSRAKDTKSDQDSLNKKMADDQKRQGQELFDLRKNFQRKPWELDTKMEKKMADLSIQVNTFTSERENLKQNLTQDLSDLQARKLESIKSECQSEIKNLREDFHKCNSQNDSISSQLSKLESEVSASREKMASMQDAIADSQNNVDGERQLARLESSIQSTLQSEIKAIKDDLENRDRLHDSTLAKLSKIESDLTDSRNDLASEEKLDNVAEHVKELDQSFTAIQRAILHLTSTQQTHGSALERLDGIAENDSSKFKAVRALMEKAHIICEKQSQDSQSLRNDQQALTLRFDSVERQVQTQKQQQPAMSNGAALDTQPGVTVAPPDIKDIEGRLDMLSEKIARLTDEVEIEAQLGTLSEQVKKIKDDEDRRDDLASDAIEECDQKVIELNDKLIKATIDIESHKSELGGFKTQLERISENQSSTSTWFGQLETGITEMKETINSVKSDETQQRLSLNDLQRQLNNLQTPPQLSPTPAVKEDVQPKIEALEMKWKGTTDKVQAIEDFQSSLDTRYNNITTEPMVKSIIYHMNQLYPLHLLQMEQSQIKQRVDQLSKHLGQFVDLVQRNRQEDTGRTSKLENMKAWEDIEKLGNRIAKLEELSKQATQTQQSNTYETTEKMQEELRCLGVRHNDAIAEVKTTIQKLQTSMNGQLLTQETRIKDHGERVDEVWQHSVAELSKIDAELRALRTQRSGSDEEQEAKISRNKSSGHGPAWTSIQEAESSSDSEPIKNRRKRLLSAQNAGNSVPATKRLKKRHHPDSDGEDSDPIRSLISASANSSRRSGRVSSQQQQQQQQQQPSSPSSQPRRRRKDPD
ncbi:MAG: hypothetical protein LQ345_003361 [Seirophora villosa]|nr:MAG: hypothetical protein LQ345_003361 [Seirophora villosa]